MPLQERKQGKGQRASPTRQLFWGGAAARLGCCSGDGMPLGVLCCCCTGPGPCSMPPLTAASCCIHCNRSPMSAGQATKPQRTPPPPLEGERRAACGGPASVAVHKHGVHWAIPQSSESIAFCLPFLVGGIQNETDRKKRTIAKNQVSSRPSTKLPTIGIGTVDLEDESML